MSAGMCGLCGQHFAPEVARPRVVIYDFPLRPDLLVRLNLPTDLTKDDAARISVFVSGLALPEGTDR